MTDLRDIRVLVVDDDDDDFLLVKTVLGRIEGIRYVLSRASSFEEGLELLTAGQHDVCLLDYRLGLRDGLELLDEAVARGLAGPFVMLTGQDSRELDLEAMRRGAADFLSKSRLDESVLERSIRYAVERARAAAELRRAHDQLEARVRERTEELQSARQEAERLYLDAQEANRLKDEFLATVSHELRTPLHVILGHADLLVTRDDGDPSAEEIVKIIRCNAWSQARLVDDLLDVSRIVTGKLKITSKPLKLAMLVRVVTDSLRLVAESRGLVLEVQVSTGADAAHVKGDAARLEQVVGNLVSNALKFTPTGGRVSVSVEASDGRVELRVSDSGQGIEASFLLFVFDRFRQADARITRTHGGLGLGLSIARHLVEAHGGVIAVASDGPDKGSTFTVSLPLADAAVVAEKAASKKARGLSKRSARLALMNDRQALAGVRILVVDDAPDVILLLKSLLRRFGADVVTANSAAEARRCIAAERPDVLLSDIGMPGEDGYELMRQLRRMEAEYGWARIPAAAMTAYARDEEKARALAAGFEMHVSKPVEAATLIRTVVTLAALPERGAPSA